MNTVHTVIVEPAALAAGHPADHYAIRHRPSGRYLARDDTLTPNVGEAIRYMSRTNADRRIGHIEPAARDEFEAVGLRYQVQDPATNKRA